MRKHEQLEAEFGEWAGVSDVVACSSGTAALHLALEALELPKGSVVIVPDFTMVACARAVTMAGLVPHFVDCDESLLMVGSVPASLNVSAVMLVHIYGRVCDRVHWYKLARWNRWKVVEDWAEAHGAEDFTTLTPDAACWSFYANKIIAGEEGGAVAFAEPECAKKARMLRSLGFTEAHDFIHIPRGCNYRLADSLAELVLISLHNYGRNLARRRELEAEYNRVCPKEWRMPERAAPWVYDMRIGEVDVSAVPGARCGFKPMSGQPEYGGVPLNPGALKASKEIVYLSLSGKPVFEQLFRVLAKD